MIKYINPLLVLSFGFFTPSLFVFLGLADSFTLGVGFVAILITIILFLFKIDCFNYQISDLVFCLLISFFVFAHLSIFTFYSVSYLKGFFSIFFLIFLFFFANISKNFIKTIDQKKFHKLMICFFSILCLVGIFPVLGLRILSSYSSIKSVFPYIEPSHYALVYTPFSIYAMSVLGKWPRILLLIFSAVLVLTLQNLTLLVSLLLLVTIFFFNYKIIAFLPIMVSVFLYADLTYFAERLNFSETSNISALVYIQGWEFMINSFVQKYGLGVGFQQLANADLNSSAADKIYEILGFNLNTSDGGFTAAKLFSEFGIFSVVIFYPLMILIFKSYISLKNAPLTLSFYGYKYIAAQSFLMGALIEFFVRGVGYFTPTLVAVLISILFIRDQKRNIGKKL